MEEQNIFLVYLLLVSVFLIEMTKLKIDHIAAETSTTKI